MSQNQIIECIPNFSEGQNLKTLAEIAAAINQVKGVKLLHMDRGDTANRTVFTFAGTPDAVVEAAFQSIKVASRLIDMRQQKGEHPRIGATDVCPLVPIANISMEEVKIYAKSLGKRVGSLGIPVFLYEHSATTPKRKNLATIRSGEYEKLAYKMNLSEWRPDFGKEFNAKTGATVMGARDFLIAYNANLNTSSTKIANQIARDIRTSGKVVKKEDGAVVRVPGTCKSLKAIGWYIDEYHKAQVSMNLTNFKETGIHTAYEACKQAAEKYGVSVTGSELIGLVPESALLAAGIFYLKQEGIISLPNESVILQTAVKHLGLSELKPFDFRERVIEYLL